jgi:hypothetical protein
MPSYEEMIVTALEEIGDPEGLAPKTVFDYMSVYVPELEEGKIIGEGIDACASDLHRHWPLMHNFRPSASQALQKAFKRGRLEKNSTKYRLNPLWEGGNVSLVINLDGVIFSNLDVLTSP